MKRIMTDLIAAMLFFIAMTTQSCVRLDLKTADDTSDEAEIGFDIAWDKVSGTALPDSVYIAMNKVSDILKYSYETDSKGAFLHHRKGRHRGHPPRICGIWSLCNAGISL